MGVAVGCAERLARTISRVVRLKGHQHDFHIFLEGGINSLLSGAGVWAAPARNQLLSRSATAAGI